MQTRAARFVRKSAQREIARKLFARRDWRNQRDDPLARRPGGRLARPQRRRDETLFGERHRVRFERARGRDVQVTPGYKQDFAPRGVDASWKNVFRIRSHLVRERQRAARRRRRRRRVSAADADRDADPHETAQLVRERWRDAQHTRAVFVYRHGRDDVRAELARQRVREARAVHDHAQAPRDESALGRERAHRHRALLPPVEVLGALRARRGRQREQRAQQKRERMRRATRPRASWTPRPARERLGSFESPRPVGLLRTIIVP